jgi:hypothetical protein
MTDSTAPAPILSFDDLPHYEWLQVPVWVFDVEHPGIRWANTAGLDFWRATALDELVARDYSDISRPARERLEASMRQADWCAKPGRSTRATRR